MIVYILQSEVNVINKQKFLAELGKLLTFMYEEDRQTALAMYSRMFDQAEDEQALLSLLVSPTRQAVVVARAYNAKERRLQVHAQFRDQDGGDYPQDEIPDFVLAIDKIQQSLPLRGEEAVPAVPAEQFCLFESGNGEEAGPVSEKPGEAPAENPAEDAAPSDEEVPAEGEAPAEDAAPAEETEEAPGSTRGEDAGSEEAPPVQAEDEVDSFLAEFSIEDSELGSDEAPQAEEGIVLMPDEDGEEACEAQAAAAVVEIDEGGELVFQSVRKPRVFLLILYIILAVPVTLAGVLLLLVPTLLALALAIGVITSGSAVLIASFSGFAVFADILVMLGTAMVILALGLLFMWIFIWLIGGAIVGLVRGVISLGGRWCYKEVPAV